MLEPEKLTWRWLFLLFDGEPASKCSYVISIWNLQLTTFRDLIFTRINFREKIFKLLLLFSQELIFVKKPISHILLELNFANFARKIFYLLQYFLYMIKKKVFTRLSRDLIWTIPKLKILLELNFPNFVNGQFTNDLNKNPFSRN